MGSGKCTSRTTVFLGDSFWKSLYAVVINVYVFHIVYMNGIRERRFLLNS